MYQLIEFKNIRRLIAAESDGHQARVEFESLEDYGYFAKVVKLISQVTCEIYSMRVGDFISPTNRIEFKYDIYFFSDEATLTWLRTFGGTFNSNPKLYLLVEYP